MAAENRRDGSSFLGGDIGSEKKSQPYNRRGWQLQGLYELVIMPCGNQT